MEGWKHYPFLPLWDSKKKAFEMSPWENFHFHKVGPWVITVITPINGLFFNAYLYKWTYFTLGAHLASGSAIPDSTPRCEVKSLKDPGGSGSWHDEFRGCVALEVCGLFPGRNIQVYSICIISKCVGTQIFSFCTCFLIRFVFWIIDCWIWRHIVEAFDDVFDASFEWIYPPAILLI